MSRSRDSDEEVEYKTGARRSRIFDKYSSENSSLRRSSRINQNKSLSRSPESETSSVNSYQTKSTKKRIDIMDSTVSETLKEQDTKRLSISSDISELTDIDIPGTPGRRTTRSSFAASIGTTSKINTRATNKRLIRAGSETKLSPSIRTIRRTRANSVGLEPLTDQNKSQPSTPVTRRRASILQSNSPTKEEIKKKNSSKNVQLDTTIAEADEISTSDTGNLDSSLENIIHSQQSKKNNQKHKSTDEDKVGEDNSHDETLQSLKKKNERQSKHLDEVDEKENLVEGKFSSEENLASNADISADETSTHNSLISSKYEKGNKLEMMKENLPEMEVTLVDIYKKSFAKELGNKTENLLNTSVEEQKKNPGDKENQTMNIISDTSTEKNVQPITSATTLCTKSLTSANKSLNEKETKSVELSLCKRRLSRGSIETILKHTVPSKVFTDEVVEDIILSTDSSSPDMIYMKKKLDNTSISETIKKQSPMDSITNNVDIKLTTTSVTNESVLLKDSSRELMRMDYQNNVEGQISDKNESEYTNIQHTTAKYTTDITSESDNINKTEYIIEDSKDSDKNESGDANKISHLSAKKIKTQEKNISSESLNSVCIVDDNEMTLLLEEQSPRRENEASSNVAPLSPNHLVNVHTCIETPPLINKSFNDKPIVMTKQSTEVKDDITDNTDSTEQGKKSERKYVTESVSKSSNAILESINSNDSSADNVVIQDNQSSDVTEKPLEKSAMDILSPEGMKEKSKNIVKRNSIRKSKDTFDNSKTEKKSSQLEENKKSTDYDSDVNIGISSFHDIPADKWKKNRKNTIMLTEKSESENETESDLIFVNRQACVSSKDMTVSQGAVLLEEYDSDDTAILESRLEELQTSYDAKKSETKKLIDFDTEEEDAIKPVKTQKSLTKKKSTFPKNKDLLTGSTEEILEESFDKFVDEFETVLNRSNDRSNSRLNKSEQATKTTERTSKLRDEPDEKIGEDTDRSNSSSQVSKKNTSLRKSMKGRKSLNKSSKDEASKQGENSVQNISRNKPRTDTSEEDNADAHREKILQKKERFLKLLDTDSDNDTDRSEKKSLSSKDNVKKDKNASLNNSSNEKSKPINTKVSTHSDNDESSDSETATNLKDSSMVAYAGSGSSSNSEHIIPSILFSSSSNDDIDNSVNSDIDNSVNSDIKREYNLDGVESKFSDDSVPADECRDSEIESSDPDDNGSDLADFIVDDEEIEDGEEENNKEKEKSDEDEDGQSIEKNGKDIEDEEVDVETDEQENEVDVEGDDKQKNEADIKDDDEQKNEVEDEDDKQNLDVDGENEEDTKGKNDVVNRKEGIDEEMSVKIEMDDNTYELSKDHKNKNKSSEYISPRISKTKKKQDIKMKSSMKENEENILLDISNSTNSIKKKKKSYLEDSSKNIAEHNPIEQLNESEMILPEKVKLHLSSSTPLSAYQKYKINKEFEIYRQTPGTKDSKTDSVNTIQNTSKKLKKKKSKKESVSEEDINLEQFSGISNKEKTLSSDSLSELLEVIEKTDHSKSTFKATKSRRTISNTFNTESSTIKYLRKEKLNDSAPVLLFDTEINQLKEKPSTSEKEVFSNETISLDDNVIQQCSQWKQKKRKRQMEEMSNETIDKVLPQDTLESNVPKNKRAKLSKLSVIKNTTSTDTYPIESNEKKKKKKKKKKQQQIDTTEKNENVNKDIPQEDTPIRKENKMELAQHKKKKNKIVSSSELSSPADNDMAMKKKVKKTVENQETLSEDPLKKEKKGKKEKKILQLQTAILKLKSDKNLESNKLQLQNIPDTTESRTSAFIKARNEAHTGEAIRAAEKRIRAKKLQEKNREDIENKKIQEQDMNTYTKKREKEVSKEKNKFEPSSTGGLKRLPDDVIENLSDIPTRARKRQKTSQNEKQILPSMPQTRKKIIATHREYNIPMNSCGSTTKFSVVNLRKTMVRPSTTDVSTAVTAAVLVKNFSRKLFDRNARIPGITYKMFSDNRFK